MHELTVASVKTKYLLRIFTDVEDLCVGYQLMQRERKVQKHATTTCISWLRLERIFKNIFILFSERKRKSQKLRSAQILSPGYVETKEL